MRPLLKNAQSPFITIILGFERLIEVVSANREKVSKHSGSPSQPASAACVFSSEWSRNLSPAQQPLLLSHFHGRRHSFSFSESKTSLVAKCSPVCAVQGGEAPLRIMISGAPVSGKGTQCELIVEQLLKIVHGNKVPLKEGVLSKAGSKEEPNTVMKEIFGGLLQSQVKCLSCSTEFNKLDDIMDLNLDILRLNSLNEALCRFFQPEVLDGENKYRCDQCKKLSPARKQMSVYRAPNVLVIQMKKRELGVTKATPEPLTTVHMLPKVDTISASGWEN